MVRERSMQSAAKGSYYISFMWELRLGRSRRRGIRWREAVAETGERASGDRAASARTCKAEVAAAAAAVVAEHYDCSRSHATLTYIQPEE
jgi:hypothetical protein